MEMKDGFDYGQGQVVALQIEEGAWSSISEYLENVIGYDALASLSVANMYCDSTALHDPVDGGVTAISFNIQVITKNG